jgi:hypothetical protein
MGVADQPDGHQIAGVEGEVHKGRQVPEELQGEVLGFIDDPDRQEVFAVQIGDSGFEVPSNLRAPVGRFQT